MSGQPPPPPKQDRPAAPTQDRPAAMLLTGGASRRMGRDKATLVVADTTGNGATLATRTARLLAAVADPVIEVGPGYTDLPRTSEQPPGTGPLAAMAAGAAALGRGRSALVVATDLPGLTHAFLERLADHRAPTAEHCVIPYDREGRAQLLCARYSPAAFARAQQLVAAGHRAMRDLIDHLLVVPLDEDVDEETGDALRDLDTPADLAALDRPRR